MGVDTPHPRFFWVPEHSDRGQADTAYEIIVSTDAVRGRRGHVVDGKVAGASPGQVRLRRETARQAAGHTTGKSAIGNANGRPSPFSQPATFGCGLFSRADWKGQWVGGKNQLRKEFVLKKIARAKAFVCGLGYSELRLNGRKIGAPRSRPGLDNVR